MDYLWGWSELHPRDRDSTGVMIGRMTYELGQGTGPLRGVKVVEVAGIGPGPHACMILADLGADVIRIDRPGGGMFASGRADLLNRGRPSVALDLKRPAAVATVLRLVEGADVLVEGMRPGAIERLGLGPEECHARNPRLVYGRMTGWGQDGPWAHAAGHDMNYIAITGALHGLGQDRDRPHFPSNLLGDFGGGSTYLVIGILAALVEARTSGQGQVVDAAIVDGTAHLNAIASTFAAVGLDTGRRASGMLDGGTPWYDVYETADGQHVSVGALEPQFWSALVERIGVDAARPRRPGEPRDHPRRPDPQVPGAYAGRVGRGLRRHGRLRRARRTPRRGAAPPAPGRARHLRRARRGHPAGAGAALLADRGHR